MNRLKTKEIGPFREARRAHQGDRCALCAEPFTETDRVVLDHNHKTGVIRGTIHSNCNVVLGRLENAARRFGVDLTAFLSGVKDYVPADLGVLHPTFLTADEKKARAKKRAKRKKINQLT